MVHQSCLFPAAHARLATQPWQWGVEMAGVRGQRVRANKSDGGGDVGDTSELFGMVVSGAESKQTPVR